MSGFTLHYFRDLSNPGTTDLKTITIDASFPLVSQYSCPVCGEHLEVLARLVGSSGEKIVRLGCCKLCGYVGYMERPSRSWLSRFYLNEWGEGREPKTLPGQRRYSPPHQRNVGVGVHPHKREMVNLLATMVENKSSLVCEIGCGKGEVLEEFRKRGFENLMGIENSKTLATFAERVYGERVLVGSFESPEINEALHSAGPVGIFFSWHVLEHSFDPAEFMKNVAELQRENDYVVLALPLAETEPLVSTIFWLPHLHSFSRFSLEKLLNRFGYEILQENQRKEGEIVVLARKVKNPQRRYQPLEDYFSFYESRIPEYFFLDEMKEGRRHLFYWTSKGFKTGVAPVFQSRLLDAVQQFLGRSFYFVSARLFGKFFNKRSFVFSLESESFSPNSSEFEIRYTGDIRLLVR